MRTLFVLVAMLTLCSAASAQQFRAMVRVDVRAAGEPVRDATVTVAGTTLRTDAAGRVTFEIATGNVVVAVVKDGYAEATTSLTVAAGALQDVVIELQRTPAVEETVTVVASTRTEKRLEDQPMRVEVLGREEIEEKLLMTPGDIVMMLNEMGGMRVQATSPSLGAASVRIQGMRGRYTRVLSDGLPLFGDVGGLGLLQIPPMDLGQVEVIKGVASALYGADAMGGVINLLSRRPAAIAEQEFLVNRSSRGATDAVAMLSGPLRGRWSASLLGGGHWQQTTDVNGDGWADLAGYSRGVVRPRLFWDNGRGRTFYATAGATYEDRNGGTIDGRVLPATGAPYAEGLVTRRYDGGASGQWLVAQRYVLNVRGAITQQQHDHRFGDVLERDDHTTAFAEASVRFTSGKQTVVGGLAFERDAYAPRDVPRFAFAFTTPGLFVQYDLDISPALAVSSSARVDVHSEYGAFVSPRISLLARAGRWTSRISVGTGFFAATPLTEETEAAGLSRLQVHGPIEAERGLSSSLDVSRTDGPLTFTATLFASRVAHPLHVDRSPSYVLRSLPDPATNAGVELLATLRQGHFSATGSYTFVRSRETPAGFAQDAPLTPRHSAGIVGMWEVEGAGRIGVEWYYTGRQNLEENPYRNVSEPYAVVGLLAEKVLGPVRLFVNGENLTGVRQTRWDPLLRPDRAADGRWTVDAWAPLEGRTVNGGVRLHF